MSGLTRAVAPARGSWPVVAVLALGVALRALTLAGSGPVSYYLNDSRDYLARAADLRPIGYHPLGYSVFLRLMDAGHHPELLSVLQHLIGVGTGVAVIATARRLRLPDWAAALAAAPQLLDPYVAVSEQFVIAETVFTALLLGAVLCAVAGRGVPAGLLLAAATLTRTVALPLLLLLVAVLAGRRLGWRRVLAGTAAFALPVLAYAGFYADTHGRPGLSEHNGIYLYGRLAPFATCPSPGLTAAEATLCDSRPPGQRPQPDFYLWSPESPLKRLGLSVSQGAALAGRTGTTLATHNVGVWATSTVRYLLHYAAPGRTAGRVDSTLTTWIVDDRTDTAPPASDPTLADGYRRTPSVRAGPTRLLRDVQKTVWTPVWLLALCALLGVTGHRGRDGVSQSRRLTWAACSAGSSALLLVPSVTVGWDIRFLLPALPLLGLAAAVGVALARPPTPPSPGRGPRVLYNRDR